MVTDTITDSAAWAEVDLERLADVAVTATLVHFGLDPEAFEISVLGCNDARITELNADFRAKPAATNVLSWPSQERGAEVDGDAPLLPDSDDVMGAELGDIAIAYETCASEAEAAGKPLADHVTHLIIHATLHLLGYDHVRDQDATLMEGIEVAILGKLGLSDPYRV